MHNRSQFLVDPKVQWSIAGRFLFHWISFLVCLVMVGVIVRLLIGAGSTSFRESLGDGVAAQLPAVGVMLILLPIFIRDTLKMSNQFAGPMYRLRTELTHLANDRPARPIKFRQGDYWQEAADDFNTVLGQLNRLQDENAKLQTQLQSQEEALV